MKPATVSTLAAVWDCRWSRPGYRLTGVTEVEQPETIWVCVRTGERRPVAEDECATCPHWQPDDVQH